MCLSTTVNGIKSTRALIRMEKMYRNYADKAGIQVAMPRPYNVPEVGQEEKMASETCGN